VLETHLFCQFQNKIEWAVDVITPFLFSFLFSRYPYFFCVPVSWLVNLPEAVPQFEKKRTERSTRLEMCVRWHSKNFIRD